MIGDLPPNSSVTGTKFSLAARMMARPTGMLPVKKIWSNGRLEKALPIWSSPVTTATCSSSNVSASIAASRFVVAGVISDGLSITRLPAASAVASGVKARETGKFQGATMPTTPRGWYTTFAEAGFKMAAT
jgi:hypothetical protein